MDLRESKQIWGKKEVSNIGFITVHGLNEGHIAPYTDIEFPLTKYQTYIIMKFWYKSLQLIIEETITLLTKIKHIKQMALKIFHNRIKSRLYNNKANLRDLIAATGLVIANWNQIVNFSARVTVKFDGWPCKTIGHLFYATSSFVHLYVPIGEFKLKLQSGNAQSGSNWMIFRAVRPWNLTDDLAKQ